MSISLVFSIGFYRVASDEINRGIRRPPGLMSQMFSNRNNDIINEIIVEQNDAVEIAQARLQASLLLINLVIFIGGGLLSYYLARRTLKPIEDAHEAQSRFTADASHELRTPISAMRLENEIALTDDNLTLKQAKKQLESNIEELDKLTKLAEGLLELARLDNDTLIKENVKVQNIIQEAVSRVATEAENNKQIIITKKIDKGLVSVNEVAMVEALVTILDNAIKYSPKKSEIIISTNRGKSNFEISVKDSGPGISPIDQKKIFDRFYRADNSRTKESSDGYGIGLSIAKTVAESHGGSISVKSVVGNGSTFTLHFPVK